METSALYNQIDEFSQQDNSLYFALGLAHATHELEKHLPASLSQGLPRQGPAVSSGSLSETFHALQQDQDDLVYLLLGIISYSRHYQELLGRFDASQPAVEIVQAASSFPRLGDDLPRPVIRQMLR